MRHYAMAVHCAVGQLDICACVILPIPLARGLETAGKFGVSIWRHRSLPTHFQSIPCSTGTGAAGQA
jgi:hypothetical protein